MAGGGSRERGGRKCKVLRGRQEGGREEKLIFWELSASTFDL